MQHFLSLEMSRHLYSLVPEFEGHWWWTYPYLNAPHAEVVCYEDLNISVKICPAWQVEDVLMHLDLITDRAMTVGQVTPFDWRLVGRTTANFLIEIPDTAYQKIEEYLWTILK